MCTTCTIFIINEQKHQCQYKYDDKETKKQTYLRWWWWWAKIKCGQGHNINDSLFGLKSREFRRSVKPIRE